jgi:ABC-type glutathione transport system ATPase component
MTREATEVSDKTEKLFELNPRQKKEIGNDPGKAEKLLEIDRLQKYYPVTEGVFKKLTGYVKAVDNVSLFVRRGETLGLVGESGCGKTTLGKCVVRLHKPTSGSMYYALDGQRRDLLTLGREESFRARRKIQMIFQDPYASLNPMKNILSAFDEPLRIHNLGNREQRRQTVAEMLERVNLLPDFMYRFPHEFSGGQRQRICIAKALALRPEMIVCDEPVSALDVSVQAQILNLMRELQESLGIIIPFAVVMKLHHPAQIMIKLTHKEKKGCFKLQDFLGVQSGVIQTFLEYFPDGFFRSRRIHDEIQTMVGNSAVSFMEIGNSVS